MTLICLEDSSPHFVRFTWDSLPQLVSQIQRLPLRPALSTRYSAYTHWNYDPESARTILRQLPLPPELALREDRVALFATPPGRTSRIHRDGRDIQFGVNIAVRVQDDRCVTSWYSDQSLADQPQETTDYTQSVRSERVPTPEKTMVLGPGEAVLFNTRRFHQWNNADSTHHRMVLTLRSQDPAIDFERARQMLFA